MSNSIKGKNIQDEVTRKIVTRHLDALNTDLQGFVGFEQQGRDFIVSYLSKNPPPQYADSPMTYKIGFPEVQQPYVRQRLSEIMAFAARAREMAPLTGRRGEIYLGLAFPEAAGNTHGQFKIAPAGDASPVQNMNAANSNKAADMALSSVSP